jgi:hypothetical protein
MSVVRESLWWAKDPEEKRFLLDRKGFLDFLESTGPPAFLTRSSLEKLLSRADEMGLPRAASGQGGHSYHQHFSWNWLYYRMPEFYEPYCLDNEALRELIGLTSEARRGACCPEGGAAQKRSRAQCLPRKIKWSVEFQVNSLSGMEGHAFRANLPVPTSIASQTEVELLGVWTGDRRLEPVRKKKFLRIKAFRPDNGGSLSIRYSYSLLKRETHAHGFRAPEPVRADLDLPIEAFLKAVKERSSDPYDRAAYLYRWMLAHSKYVRGRTGCLCYKCAPKKFVTRRGGNSFLLAKTFMAFARELDIPTRAVFGSIASYLDPSRSGSQVSRIQGGSVTSHAWLQFEVPDVGWFPIDFLQSSIGGTTLNRNNCKSPPLRARLIDEHRFLRNFYFGNSDSLRVQLSTNVRKIQILEHTANPGPESVWTKVPIERLSSTVRIEPL